MAIANIQETLLMYTKQKSSVNAKLSDVMMDMYTITRQNADEQQKFLTRSQDLYYDPDFGYGKDEAYFELSEQLEDEHEFELARLNAWESELELEKNELETQLNEITNFENTWTKLLQTNVKNDFSYGSAGK